MNIRQASITDRAGIRDLYLQAFPESESESVAAIAGTLLADETAPETFALVAESEGMIIGHVAFSPVTLVESEECRSSILAPLAVHPSFQRRGTGTRLINAGFEHLALLGTAIVFVYGDPQYYGRFGFEAGLAAPYAPPYRLQQVFGWQAKLLTDGDKIPSSGNLTCVSSLMDPDLW